MIPTHEERFNYIGKLGYAKNYSKGRKVYRETSLAIHFPKKGGKWVKLFWRFYWQTESKGYND